LRKTSPPQGEAGGTAKFVLEITNTGDVPLTGLAITDRYDTGLVPEQATEGHEFDDDDQFSWKFPTLAPGKSLALEVVCRCADVPGRVCSTAKVTTDQDVSDEAEACLEIVALTTQLSIDVSDDNDPVQTGKELTYDIHVNNDGASAARQVVVTATVPPGMSVVNLSTTGPKGTSRPEIVKQTIRFAPLAELPAGQSATWRVRVKVRKAGKAVFKANVDGEGVEQPQAAETTTTAFSRSP
jgi:uncharacterized repeat protein (TIGR01451 family)